MSLPFFRNNKYMIKIDNKVCFKKINIRSIYIYAFSYFILPITLHLQSL